MDILWILWTIPAVIAVEGKLIFSSQRLKALSLWPAPSFRQKRVHGRLLAHDKRLMWIKLFSVYYLFSGCSRGVLNAASSHHESSRRGGWWWWDTEACSRILADVTWRGQLSVNYAINHVFFFLNLFFITRGTSGYQNLKSQWRRSRLGSSVEVCRLSCQTVRNE